MLRNLYYLGVIKSFFSESFICLYLIFRSIIHSINVCWETRLEINFFLLTNPVTLSACLAILCVPSCSHREHPFVKNDPTLISRAFVKHELCIHVAVLPEPCSAPVIGMTACTSTRSHFSGCFGFTERHRIRK